MFIKGMNRLRAAYVDIDPSLAPYFITGLHDDEPGIAQTYAMGVEAPQCEPGGGELRDLYRGGQHDRGRGRDRVRPVADGRVGRPRRRRLVGVAHFAFWVWLGWRSWQANINPA